MQRRANKRKKPLARGTGRAHGIAGDFITEATLPDLVGRLRLADEFAQLDAFLSPRHRVELLRWLWQRLAPRIAARVERKLREGPREHRRRAQQVFAGLRGWLTEWDQYAGRYDPNLHGYDDRLTRMAPHLRAALAEARRHDDESLYTPFHSPWPFHSGAQRKGAQDSDAHTLRRDLLRRLKRLARASGKDEYDPESNAADLDRIADALLRKTLR